MNALKHGIRSKRRIVSRTGVLSRGFVIPKLEGHHAATQFRALMSALVVDRQPIGALEMLMVQEIGVCTWRLRRLLKFENRAAYLESLNWTAKPDEDGDYEYDCDEILQPAGLNDLTLPASDDAATISRYEAGLMRDLFRAIDHLDRMQRQRRAAAPENDPEKAPRSQRSKRILQCIQGE